MRGLERQHDLPDQFGGRQRFERALADSHSLRLTAPGTYSISMKW